MMLKYGLILRLVLFAFTFYTMPSTLASASTPSSKKPQKLFQSVVLYGDDMVKCFPGVKGRVNGGTKNIQHNIMSLLSIRPRLDKFVFDVTKALGAKHPTVKATDVPDELNDETPEILALSNIFRLISAANTIHIHFQRGNVSLIDFKSAVSTYVKLSTDYIKTLIPLTHHPKLSKLRHEITQYIAMLNTINNEILPVMEQLEDLYIRPTNDARCDYEQRMKWAVNDDSLSENTASSYESDDEATVETTDS
jgi:hypothetical protein